MITTNMHDFTFNQLWQKRGTIATLVMIGVLAALLVSAATPIRYASTAELLVVQRGIFARDPSVASRSTEYLSQVFAEVVNSRSFLEAVRVAAPNVFDNVPTDPERQKRWWNKRVQAHVVRDTGILKLAAYDRNRERVGALADAVVATLLARGSEYHGEGDAVSIRVLESPITTRYPATPAVGQNLLVGLVAGLLAALGLVFLWPEANVALSLSKGFRRQHKSLFDWHIPGETAEAALERMQTDQLKQTDQLTN